MSKGRELLGVINCLGNGYGTTISFFDLFVFATFSFIIVTILLTYYSTLNKKRFKNDNQITNNKISSFTTVNIISVVFLLFVMMSSFERLINYNSVLMLISLGLSIFYLNYFHNKEFFKVKKVFKKFHMMDTPIYKSNKDVLLQDVKVEGVYLANTQKLSVWAKFTVYLLIILAITTPLYQLFGIQHFI